MPRDHGRVEKPLGGKWRAIGYTSIGKDIRLGTFDTRDDAVAALRKYVTDRRDYGHGRKG
jgi:hypothetical protein